jgi:translation factor GUF1, mitochondrial
VRNPFFCYGFIGINIHVLSITSPTVPYKIVYKDRVVTISNPTDFPDGYETTHIVVEVQEPMVNATIIVPQGMRASRVSVWSPIDLICAEFLGEMMDLCSSHRGQNMDHRYLELAGAAGVDSAPRVILTAKLPLSEVVTDFFDALKHRSSGYASFECVTFHQIELIFCHSLATVMRMLGMKPAI